VTAIDFGFALQAFRRDFEDPREQQDREEPEREQDHDAARHPLRRPEQRKDRARDLHQQPRGDQVEAGRADDVAAHQFRDEAFHRGPRPTGPAFSNAKRGGNQSAGCRAADRC